MKTANPILASKTDADEFSLMTELLILPDGTILVHSLTTPFAALLSSLNPECNQITDRVKTLETNEFPD